MLLISVSFFAGSVMAEDARTVRDVPLSDLRMMLKGYPGDWRPDTDRAKGVPEPARVKPVAEDAVVVQLPALGTNDVSLSTALTHRRSQREFSAESLSLGELGYLLWSAQGVTEEPHRTAPSAGGRYPLETYILVLRVDGVAPGVHRYLPATHQLVEVRAEPELKARVVDACYQQAFVGEAAAVLVWAAVPERTEWKYGYLAHRMIAMEAGHACQNVYLACEAVGAGACALLSYDQNKLNALLGIDGENEFALYLAAVGKTGK